MAKAEQQDRRAAMARRSAKLLRVLVAGGVALATACAGVQKGGQGSSSDPAGPPSQPRSGGGASGW
jgi:hypothetical protein